MAAEPLTIHIKGKNQNAPQNESGRVCCTQRDSVRLHTAGTERGIEEYLGGMANGSRAGRGV
jgi:hypothetical protein